jgi:MFS transporter, OFA family, oxalate/formate antiporter
VLTTMTGSWHAVFLAAAALNIVAALLALFVLKPMRAAYTKKPEASLAPVLAQ